MLEEPDGVSSFSPLFAKHILFGEANPNVTRLDDGIWTPGRFSVSTGTYGRARMLTYSLHNPALYRSKLQRQ